MSLQIGQSNPQTRVWALELPERPSAPRPGYADVADRCGISPLYVRTASGKTFYNYCRGSPVTLRDPNGTDSSRVHEVQSEIAYLEQTIESGSVEGEEAAELTLRLNKLQAELGELKTPEPEPFTPAPPGYGKPEKAAAEPAKPRITIPHMEGVEGSVLPQIPSIEDTGSPLDNAANYIFGWGYNLEALVLSAVVATVEGTDRAVVEKLKAAGLSSVDIQAIRDVGMLHSAQLAQAFRSGVTGLRQFVAHARAVSKARQQVPTIRGTIAAFRDPRNITAIKEDMRAGKFAFEEARGKIAGVIDEKGVVHVTEGHHRMAAAQELLEETGDPSFVQQLLKHGEFRRGKPPSASRRFPKR